MSHQGSTDLKNAPPLALGVVVLGGLVFILSFFGWYGGSVSVDLGGTVPGFSTSVSVGAWSFGFLAWFPVMLAVAGAVIGALSFASPQTLQSVKVPPFLLVLALDVVAIVLLLLRWLTAEKGSSEFFSYGVKWAFFLSLLLVIAQGVLAYLTQVQSGSLSSAISSVTDSMNKPSAPPMPPPADMPPPVDPNIPPQG